MKKTNLNPIVITALLFGSFAQADTVTCPETLHFLCAKNQSPDNASVSVCTADAVSDLWTFVAPDHQEQSANKPMIKSGQNSDPHRSDSNLDSGDYDVKYSSSYSGPVRGLSDEVAYCMYFGNSKTGLFMAGLYNKDYHHDQSSGWKLAGDQGQYMCQDAKKCGFILKK